MNIDIRAKIKPIDVLGKMAVEDYSTNDHEVYLDDKRAPKLIEEALLFFLNVKGEIYVHQVLKEMETMK